MNAVETIILLPTSLGELIGKISILETQSGFCQNPVDEDLDDLFFAVERDVR